MHLRNGYSYHSDDTEALWLSNLSLVTWHVGAWIPSDSFLYLSSSSLGCSVALGSGCVGGAFEGHLKPSSSSARMHDPLSSRTLGGCSMLPQTLLEYSSCIVTSITSMLPQKFIWPHTTKDKQELLLHTVFEYMSKFTLSYKSVTYLLK